MDNKEKWDAFKEELALIRNETIKQFALNAVAIMPDYFFEMPASTTGKYHPNFALGNGGLLRHSKAVARMVVILVRQKMWSIGLTSDDVDLAIVSGMIHDGWKKGDGAGKWTTKDHPLYAASMLKNDEIVSKILDDDKFKIVCGCISSHMGEWTEGGILPEPLTKLEKLIHEADYLASRKQLEFNFDSETKRELL